MDWTQFFNPTTWGSWAPGSAASRYSGPAGDIGFGTGVGATGPIPQASQPSPFSSLLSPLRSALGGDGGGGYSRSGYTGATGDVGYGTGVGPTGPIPDAPPTGGTNPLGGSGQNWNNLMQKVGMSMLQPQAAQPQPLQMAKPVGPGQLPPPRPPPDFSADALRRLFQSGGFSSGGGA
jgi:hypothetical protein